jgi:serine phosphatase RsbU (regulator of sigma subunit)
VALVLMRVRTHLALSAAKKEIADRNAQLVAEREVIEEVILLMRDSRKFDQRYLRYLISSVDKTNGDVLLSAFTPTGSQWILVGDISGHGPAAAIGIPLVAQIFYRNVSSRTDPSATLAELNQAMFEKLPATIYMPYVLIEVSPDRMRFCIWNGGLPGCFLDEPNSVPVHFSTTTFPMGMCADYRFGGPEYHEIDMPRNGRLWIFTDGLSELLLQNGKRLGVAGVVSVLANVRPLDALTVLWQKLEERHGAPRFLDDLTLVEVQPCLADDQM